MLTDNTRCHKECTKKWQVLINAHQVFHALCHQICPVCAAQPGSDPNHLTDNFLAHLSMDHRALRDLDWMVYITLCCT